MFRRSWVAFAVVLAGGLSAAAAPPSGTHAPIAAHPSAARRDTVGHVVKSEAQWRKELTPEQYRVLREKGTEIAFTGAFWNNHADGVYRCAACGLTLFSSRTKYDSGTGWPSFWAPIDPTHVRVAEDRSLAMERDEVQCARCGGHLGHVFDDGPAPTHQRYCMNSAALEFEEKK